MKHCTLIKVALLLAVLLVATSAFAQPQGGRGRGIYGDWVVKQDFNGRTFESILSFSRDQDGNQTGVWISFMGLNELKDLTFADGKLTFTQARPNRDGGTTETKFTGSITESVLKGTMSGGQRGDYELTGTRAPRMPRAAGQWELKYSMSTASGSREITSTLVIKADAEGNLSAEMPSGRGETTISNLALENRNELSFKRVSKFQEREFESTFKGTLRGDEITGTFTSARGEAQVTGTRIGSALIGTWNLDVDSEFGARKQRLVVNPDMSGLYGSMPVKEIKLDGDNVSFKLVMEFGQNTFEQDFAGKIAESGLTGTLSSERNGQTFSQKITGTKVVRRRGPRNTG
jgi:hypothetical protein